MSVVETGFLSIVNVTVPPSSTLRSETSILKIDGFGGLGVGVGRGGVAVGVVVGVTVGVGVGVTVGVAVGVTVGVTVGVALAVTETVSTITSAEALLPPRSLNCNVVAVPVAVNVKL